MQQPHQLLVNELDASQTRSLQQLDLRLDQQVEGYLRNEETWPRTSRVSNGCPDVLGREVVGWVDALESSSENVVEDVVDPSSSAQLLGRYVERSSVDGGNEVSVERERGEESNASGSRCRTKKTRCERTERSCSSG